jgi:putative transposase
MTAGKAIVPYLPQPPAVQYYEPIRRLFGPNDRIGLGFERGDGETGTYYKCISTFARGHVFERIDEPGFTETFTHERIAELENSAGWRYDRDYFTPEVAEARITMGELRVEDLHPNRKRRVLYKQAICDLLRQLFANKQASRCDAGIDRGLKIIFEHHGENLDRLRGKPRADGCGFERWIPCTRRILEWLRHYKKANFTAIALIDGYIYGPQPSPLDEEICDILFRVALEFASSSKTTKKDVYARLESEIAKVNKKRAEQKLEPHQCPDYNTLSARIDANGACYNYAGKWGADKVKQHFALVMGGVGATRIGQRVEMDFWTIHLKTWLKYSQLWPALSPDQKDEIEKGRWTLCTAIDCASQIILGARMSPTETSDAAIATLEMTGIDKTAYALSAGAISTWHMFAGCETLASDQGPAFIHHNFRAACLAAGIKFDNPPAAMPHLRGKIERLFRTIDLEAFCRLVGRTFENVVAKGDEKVDLTALTIEQLAVVLVLYIVDHYHREAHESLGGDTPLDSWETLYRRSGAAPPPDKRTRRNAFGLRLTRKISKKGVRVLNLFYNNRKLNEYLRKVGHGCEVEVMVDRHDLGWISVKIGEAFWTIPCVIPELHAVSIVVWTTVCEDMRRRFKSKTIPSHAIALEALDRIEEIGDAARLAYSIASPIITPEIVNRLEHSIEIPWQSREAALANPDAGGDVLLRKIQSNPDDCFQPPSEPPDTPTPRTAPQDWEDVDPETGEFTPAPSPPDPEDDDDVELPDGWTLEDQTKRKDTK